MCNFFHKLCNTFLYKKTTFELYNNFKTEHVKNLGVVLIAAGVIMIGITSFNYVTKKKVIDIGNIQISRDENHTVQWSPIIGGLLLVGGVVVFVVSKKK